MAHLHDNTHSFFITVIAFNYEKFINCHWIRLRLRLRQRQRLRRNGIEFVVTRTILRRAFNRKWQFIKNQKIRNRFFTYPNNDNRCYAVLQRRRQILISDSVRQYYSTKYLTQNQSEVMHTRQSRLDAIIWLIFFYSNQFSFVRICKSLWGWIYCFSTVSLLFHFLVYFFYSSSSWNQSINLSRCVKFHIENVSCISICMRNWKHTHTHTQHTHSRTDTSALTINFCNFCCRKFGSWMRFSFYLSKIHRVQILIYVFDRAHHLSANSQQIYRFVCAAHRNSLLFIYVRISFLKYQSKMFFNVCHCQSRIVKLCTL